MSLETVAALIGIITFVGGLIAWYRGAVQKEYASQRDWEHVKNNQKQLATNLDFMFKEIEYKLDKITDEHDKRFDKIDVSQIKLESMFFASLGLKKKRQEDESNYS